ncbi:MAG: hypothetical protein Q9187_005933, partial [Circinaria calcarea]
NASRLPAVHQNGGGPRLRILDLCTGTGCIPLLLHALLSPHVRDLTIVGLDISTKAVSLAKKNLDWNIHEGHLQSAVKEQIIFVQGDVFSESSPIFEGHWDIVISNPPYISPQGFNRDTSRSVRNYEPKLALVPPAQVPPEQSVLDDVQGDLFYPRLLKIASQVNAKLVLMEVDGTCQALRVKQMIHDMQIWDGCEFWMDEPSNRNSTKKFDSEHKTRLVGLGSERS